MYQPRYIDTVYFGMKYLGIIIVNFWEESADISIIFSRIALYLLRISLDITTLTNSVAYYEGRALAVPPRSSLCAFVSFV
jgi:hypothetical protein